MSTIQRINYRNPKGAMDFEIVELQHFFATRPQKHLVRDFRLNFWVMIYVIEGKGAHSVDFEDYPYEPGDIIVISRNQVHHFHVNDGLKGYAVHINEPFFIYSSHIDGVAVQNFFDRPYHNPIINADTSDGTTNRIIMDLINDIYENSKGDEHFSLIQSLFQSFIISLKDFTEQEALSLAMGRGQHYNAYRNLVEKHYQEHWTVEDYAREMGLSKKTVNQSVKEATGKTAKGFIVERTVLEIKRYLSQGSLMNYEISDYLGFDEPSNMTKYFKRYAGMSPKEFRVARKS